MGRHSLPKRNRALATQLHPEFGLDEQFVADIRLWREDTPTMPIPVFTADDVSDIGLDILFGRSDGVSA